MVIRPQLLVPGPHGGRLFVAGADGAIEAVDLAVAVAR